MPTTKQYTTQARPPKVQVTISSFSDDDIEAAKATQQSDGGRGPSADNNETCPAALSHRLLNASWFNVVEKCTVNLYIVVLLLLLFSQEFAKDASENFHKALFYGLFTIVAVPHVLVFLPLNVSYLWSFPGKKTRVQLLLSWKLYTLELILLTGIMLSIVLFFTAAPLQQNNSSIYEMKIIASIAATMAIALHILSLFQLDLKRVIGSLVESEGANVYRKIDFQNVIRSSTILTSNDMEALEKALNDMTTYQSCPECQSIQKDFLCEHTAGAIKDLQLFQKADLKAPCCCARADLGRKIRETLESTDVMSFKSSGSIGILIRLCCRFPFLSSVFTVCALISNSLITLIPMSLSSVISAISNFEPNDPSSKVLFPGMILIGNVLMIPVFDSLSLRSVFKLGASIETFLKESLLRKVCGVGPPSSTSIVQSLTPGDLSSRFSRDIGDIANFIQGTIYFDFFSGTIRYVGSVVILGIYDPRMAFFFGMCVPALIATQIKTALENNIASGNTAGRVLGRFQNLVQLRRTLTLYDSGDFVWSKTAGSIQEDLDDIEKSAARRSTFIASVNAWTNIYIALLSFAFIVSSIEEAREGGDAVALATIGLMIISQIYGPISQLSRAGQVWLKTVRALHRMRILVEDGASDLEQGVADSATHFVSEKTAESIPHLARSLELRDVQFQYPEATTKTLKGVNAEFTVGEYTCIVGESGAGKSTLLNVLTRELTETEGSVLIDGKSIESNAVLRKQLGVVLQSSSFFDGSIADNIRMGKPNATDAEIQKAVERAQCAKFVSGFPDGLDTLLGAADINLSGGQAQRISLARALVRSPRVLILDEATSALDRVTEQGVIETISHLARSDQVAVISVTHRLDSTDASDSILVLKEGVVAEQGTPEELNAAGTLFYNIRTGMNI